MKTIFSIIISTLFVLLTLTTYSQSANKSNSKLLDQPKIKFTESPRSTTTVSSRNDFISNNKVRISENPNPSGKLVYVEKRKVVPSKKYTKRDSKKITTTNTNKL